MGDPACDALTAELELDRVEGRLATELPPHMRGFAAAYAAGRPEPSAPRIPGALAAAMHACMHDVLLDRGIALLRLVAPLVIEDAPAVVAARAAAPSWPAYSRLLAARDVAAQAAFGKRAVDLMHALAGVRPRTSDLRPPELVAGWKDRDIEVDIEPIWRAIAQRLGVTGRVTFVRADVRPRTFVIEPKAEVIVVLPRIDSPATRFQALHELGHAAAAFAAPAGLPRALDEAAAAYVARWCEPGSWLPAPWPNALSISARARRLAIAQQLDAIERATSSQHRPFPPPWALWHDPGAQASYIEAETLADRLAGDFALALALERATIDARMPL